MKESKAEQESSVNGQSNKDKKLQKISENHGQSTDEHTSHNKGSKQDTIE